MIPFGVGMVALRNFLAAIGETRVPLFIIVGMTALNAFLNYLLIFGSWGFPKLELVGAGSRRPCQNIVAFAAIALYCALHRKARPFDLFSGSGGPTGRACARSWFLACRFR